MLRDVDDDDHVDNQTLRERVNERWRVKGGTKRGKRSIYLLAFKSKRCCMQMVRMREVSEGVKGMINQIHVIYG